MYKILLHLTLHLDCKHTKSKELKRKIHLPYVPISKLEILIDSLRTQIDTVLWHHKEERFLVFLEAEDAEGDERLFERFADQLTSEGWSVESEDNSKTLTGEVKFINCEDISRKMNVSNDFKIG